jgi:hypothetical protein
VKAGDYLHLKVGNDWDFFYPIISLNESSISVLPPKNVKPPEGTTIHRVSEVWDFSSRSPRMRINDGIHSIHIRRRSESKDDAA